MAGYATRARRGANAAQKAPPKVFAREDADGVRREKKRRADGDAPVVPGEAGADGRAMSKEERRAAKKARKAEKSALLAQVQGARGTAPAGETEANASANPNRSERAVAETAPSSSKPPKSSDDPKRKSNADKARGPSGNDELSADARSARTADTTRPPPKPPPKPKKSHGCKELDDLSEYFVNLGGAPLAPGWTVDRHTRSTDGSGYHYFRNPQGVRFRSKVEAAKHYGLFDNAFGDAASKEKNKAKQTKKNDSAVSVAAPLAVSAFVGDAKNTKKKKKEKEKRGGQQDRPVDGELLLLGDAEKKKKKKKKKKPRTPWEYVKVDGEVFRRGDCAYVISDKTIDLDDDAEEICAACGTTHGPSGVTQSRNEGEGEGDADVMLECDGCLRGWHLGCLTPPLLEVPDAEWVCPMCLASEDGVAAPDERTRKRTACSEFLDGRLHLCRIENIWSEGSEFKFVGRWFATPEETHTGRRSHHARREVFLTGVTDENNVDALLKRATVLPPQQFRDAARHAAKAASAARRRAVAAKAAAGEGDLNRVAETAVAANENDDEDSVDAAAVAAARAAGEDVFLCEYTYDAHFQRFKRRNEWEDDEFSDDEGRGRSGRLARGEERYLDDDDFGDDSDASDAPEDEDDGGEWNAARRKNGKQNANKSDKSNKRALRGRAVSRHITASRRKAAAASGEAGVMGLGAMAIRVVEREAPATKLSRARVALSLATTPGSMPCREHERAKIYDFVEQAINEGSACRGRSMYISGVPGTGKTATVREVIRALRKKSRDGYLPRFNHVELNGLRLQTPKHAYSAIAEELLGERLGPDRACEVLDARFRDGRGADGRVTVLVADEMDLLVTRSSSLLYNLFDWPTHRASRLVILGIANTLDLPERLMPKISSRLGNNKVVFKPYTAEQLKKIVHARLDDARSMKSSTLRLGGLSGFPERTSEPLRKNVVEEKNDSAFEAVAVELASRKVAAVSGDARRVLELCRRAAELAETLAGRSFDEAETAHAYDGDLSAAEVAELDRRRRRVAALDKAQVAMQHIKAAMFEMFQSPHMRMLEAASRHDRIFLCALLLELRASGVTEARVSNVMRRHVQLCRAHAEPEPPAGAAVSIACRLASSGLLLADPGRRRAAQRVCLNVPMEDVAYALKDERRLQERKLAAHEALRRATGGRPSEKNTNGGVASAATNAALAAQTEADRGDIPWIRQMDL